MAYRASRTASLVVRLLAPALVAAMAACGGSSSNAPPPPTPAGVTATPADGQISVTWAPVTGATSYDVYYGSTPAITTASTRLSSAAGSQVIPGSNGAPIWFAVAATNGVGSSPLTAVACAVPSPGGAPGAGFAQYDALCGAALDGTLYTTAEQSRRIVNGALELRAKGTNVESSTLRGVRPNSTVAHPGVGPAQRVTSWRATITVPAAATATRTGSATLQASITLQYQPVANRLVFPAALLNNVSARVGLDDDGAGLRFSRNVNVCTNASCSTSDSTTGVSYADGSFPNGQAASYGTAYTFTLSLDEATRLFTYSVSGAGLPGVLTGTADASAMFAAAGVTPNDVYLAQLRTRVVDPGAGGGGGTMLATFDDVQRGINGAPLAPYDDFSAPTIDPARWATGEASIAMSGGALELAPRLTSTAATLQSGGMTLTPSRLPADARHIRVDVTIADDSAAAESQNRFVLTRALYNDGTPGVAPNLAGQNSAVGDVQGQIVLTRSSATFTIFRSTSASAASGPLVSSTGNALPASAARPLGVGTTHTLRMSWDPSAHAVTFQLDDASPVVVDPTVAGTFITAPAPVAQAAPHAPLTTLVGVSSVDAGAVVGTAAAARFRLNNLLTAP